MPCTQVSQHTIMLCSFNGHRQHTGSQGSSQAAAVAAAAGTRCHGSPGEPWHKAVPLWTDTAAPHTKHMADCF